MNWLDGPAGKQATVQNQIRADLSQWRKGIVLGPKDDLAKKRRPSNEGKIWIGPPTPAEPDESDEPAQPMDKPKKARRKKKNTKVPEQWKKCPKKGELIQGKQFLLNFNGFCQRFLFFIEPFHLISRSFETGIFLPFKTPLDDRYSNQLLPNELFTPEMMIESCRSDGTNEIGLWIDLTSTNRFYDKSLITSSGIRYVSGTE